MFILNQDRDTLYPYQNGDLLQTKENIVDGKMYGLNLFLEENFLGTFDSVLEIADEMKNIINCKYQYYVVGGFWDYDECFN